MRQAKLRRRKESKHLTLAAETTTTATTPTLSPAAKTFTPTTTALTLSPAATPFTPTVTKSRSELWAEAAPPPTPTPSSIHLTNSPTTSHSLWAEPAPPPSPTPSSIALSHTTSLTPTHNNSPNYYNNTSPLTPIPNKFDTWPPISPIPMCYEPHNLTNSNMNDTYLHTPNNHMMDDLPQNITIMNDTYIPYNFYKL